LNTLRWCWRRSRLNHNDPAGWQRALFAARKHQVKVGAQPEDYVYEPPPPTPPTDPRIKAVFRRANAFEPARVNPVVDRATRTRARRKKLIAPRTPEGFIWQAFIQRHWVDVFSSIWRTHRLGDQDPDSEVARLLAIAYRDKLDEQEKAGGMVGPATRRWDQLLRDLRQGVRPGQAPTPTPPRQLPPIMPSATSRVAPDNDAVIQEIFDRVLYKP
jgi:hypothetical protein